MKASKLLILFILTSSVLAQDMRGLCFDRSTSLQSVKTYVSKIISRHDKVIINSSKHCVELIAATERMDLFEKFISMNFKIESRYGGSSTIVGRECLFLVEQLKNSNKKSRDFELSKNPSAIEKSSNSSAKSTSTLRVLESKTAQLYVNEKLVTLTCKIRNRVTLVDISLGSKKTNVITTIEMNKGQRVNLARVVDDLNNKDSGIVVSTGIDKYSASKSKTTGMKSESFYLTLK
jgi:hypothetical protein